jgi:hypothetical protein
LAYYRGRTVGLAPPDFSGPRKRDLWSFRIALNSPGPKTEFMRTVTIPTSLHAATGRTRIALSVASVAAFPLRLALHYAHPSPPSRPMAAVIRRQSREDHETARAGYEGLPTDMGRRDEA